MCWSSAVGPAGLSVSHELACLGIDHLVLERGRIGQTWRDRWDSFCLVTPNWTVRLPGRGRTRATTPTASCRATTSSPTSSDTPPPSRRRSARACRSGRSIGPRSPDSSRARLPATCSRRSWCSGHRRVPASASSVRRVDRCRGPPAAGRGGLPRTRSGLPRGCRHRGQRPVGCQLAEELHEAGRDVVLSCGPRAVGTEATGRSRLRLVERGFRVPRPAGRDAAVSCRAPDRQHPGIRSCRRPRPAPARAARAGRDARGAPRRCLRA